MHPFAYSTKLLILIAVVGLPILGFFAWTALGGTTFNLTLTTNPDLEAGLAGHWTFDGSLNTEITDRSGNGNHGYFFGVATSSAVRFGKIGQGVQFFGEYEGSNDYVNTTYAPNLATSDFSIGAWFKSGTSTPAFSAIFESTAETGLRDERVRLGFNNGNCLTQVQGEIGFVVRNTNSALADAACSGKAYNDGEWHHVTAVFDNTNLLILIDGVLVGSTAVTDRSSGDKDFSGFPFFIGAGNDQGNGPVSQFDGQIDDVRFYTRALTLSEVERLYQIGATTKINLTLTTNPDLEAGLAGHWTFDGPDMNPNARDRSGQGNHGNLIDFTSTTTVPGRIGQGLEFDKSDDIVNAGSDASLDDIETMTIAAWIYPKSIGKNSGSLGGGHIVVKFSEFAYLFGSPIGLADGWIFHLTNNGTAGRRQLSFQAECGSADLQVASDITAITFNTWQHVVVTAPADTCTASDVHLFIDGEEVSYATQNDGNNVRVSEAASDLTIGRNNVPDENFSATLDGTIDDVRVYDRALSPAEIKRLYELGATTRINLTLTTAPDLEAGLAGHWTFDGGLSSQITDRSGNGNTAYFATSTATSSAVSTGKIGQGVELDGSDDYIIVTTNTVPIYNASNFTASVAFWVKGPKQGPANALRGNIIYSERRSDGAGNFLLATGPAGGCCGDQRDNLVIEFDSTCCSLINLAWTEAVVLDDTWHHVVWTDNNGNGEIYIDGVPNSPGNGSWEYTPSGTHGNDTVSIGGDSLFQLFDGKIDDFRVYDRALSSAEVKRLYELSR